MERNLRARVGKLERETQPAQNQRIILAFSDGVVVDGVEMTYQQFREEHEVRPSDYVVRVGLSMAAI